MGNQTGPPHSDLKVLISRGAPRRSGARLRGAPHRCCCQRRRRLRLRSAKVPPPAGSANQPITSLAVALLAAAPGYGLGSTPPSAPPSMSDLRKTRVSTTLPFILCPEGCNQFVGPVQRLAPR